MSTGRSVKKLSTWAVLNIKNRFAICQSFTKTLMGTRRKWIRLTSVFIYISSTRNKPSNNPLLKRQPTMASGTSPFFWKVNTFITAWEYILSRNFPIIDSFRMNTNSIWHNVSTWYSPSRFTLRLIRDLSKSRAFRPIICHTKVFW